MKTLERLSEATEQSLHGLSADDALKHRILRAAADTRSVPRAPLRFRTAIMLCALSALLLVLCLAASRMPSVKDSGDVKVVPAGSKRIESPVRLQTFLNPSAGSESAD